MNHNSYTDSYTNQPMRYALPEIVGDEFVGRREELAYLRRIIGRAQALGFSIKCVIDTRSPSRQSLQKQQYHQGKA